MQTEIIVTNVAEAIMAEKYGADRLELIDDFTFGGLTPDPLLIKQVCESVSIPVNVMLRPHGRNFVYNQSEIRHLMYEIEYVRGSTWADGIVFGALTEAGNIDLSLLAQVIKEKERLKLTFHRALDVSTDIFSSYRELLDYPEVDYVLTSGGMDTAFAGAETIKQMLALKGERNNCSILAGCGITPSNALDVMKATGVEQIHVGSGVRTNGQLDEDKLKKLRSLKYI